MGVNDGRAALKCGFYFVRQSTQIFAKFALIRVFRIKGL
jgi:hypothetical protein